MPESDSSKDTWTRDLSVMMVVWFVAVAVGGVGLLVFGDAIASL